MSLPRPATVLEAESIGVREALSWTIQCGETQGIIETDSLLKVRALHGRKRYLVEVGHVFEDCKGLLKSHPGFVVFYVRRQANKVAHEIARHPCIVNCSNVFTSPPDHLLETIMKDCAN